MGHKLTDVDAFGAAMGIYRAALALEKRAYIVINEVSASLRPLYELFEQDSNYPDDLFLTSSQAMNMADENSLIALSTCSEAETNGRVVLIGKLEREVAEKQ